MEIGCTRMKLNELMMTTSLRKQIIVLQRKKYLKSAKHQKLQLINVAKRLKNIVRYMKKKIDYLMKYCTILNIIAIIDAFNNIAGNLDLSF